MRGGLECGAVAGSMPRTVGRAADRACVPRRLWRGLPLALCMLAPLGAMAAAVPPSGAGSGAVGEGQGEVLAPRPAPAESSRLIAGAAESPVRAAGAVEAAQVAQAATRPSRTEPRPASSAFSPYALAAALCGAALFMSRRRRVG